MCQSLPNPTLPTTSTSRCRQTRRHVSSVLESMKERCTTTLGCLSSKASLVHKALLQKEA